MIGGSYVFVNSLLGHGIAMDRMIQRVQMIDMSPMAREPEVLLAIEVRFPLGTVKLAIYLSLID